MLRLNFLRFYRYDRQGSMSVCHKTPNIVDTESTFVCAAATMPPIHHAVVGFDACTERLGR